jgi:hypothetical protein
MPTPIRHEYGTPRYKLAPNVETSDAGIADLHERCPKLDLNFPFKAGYYFLYGNDWLPTDGLTYRTHNNCILVKGS